MYEGCNSSLLAGDINSLIVETDEESPVTVAEITVEDVSVATGYRVRVKVKSD